MGISQPPPPLLVRRAGRGGLVRGGGGGGYPACQATMGVPGGGGGVSIPTYMARNDPHVALIILTTHM